MISGSAAPAVAMSWAAPIRVECPLILPVASTGPMHRAIRLKLLVTLALVTGALATRCRSSLPASSAWRGSPYSHPASGVRRSGRAMARVRERSSRAFCALLALSMTLINGIVIATREAHTDIAGYGYGKPIGTRNIKAGPSGN